jgi:hypothetical protein
VENIKEMPYREKYEIVLDNVNFAETFASAFVKQHLGDQAVIDLQTIYQEGIKPVPEEATFEEKYESAYSNWIWMGKSDFEFIRQHMGEEGIAQFERADVEALKRKNASPSLYFLSLIRAISPGTAFKMTAKEFAYQLQWITPFSVSVLDQSKTVFDIPRCKILDYPESDALCHIGCQGIYPKWVAEQFKVRMEFDRQGNSCTCTLTPLS